MRMRVVTGRGRRALAPGLLACLCVAPGLGVAQEGELSSRRDHMLAVNRDLAVACKPGDLERVPGKSLGEVFGDAWPVPLEADSDAAYTGPRMASIPMDRSLMRGLPAQPALVVAAVLVDVSGKAVQVEPLCATSEGYDMVTRRLLRRASWVPATIDGKPVAAVTTAVLKYRNSMYVPEGR